MTKGAVTGKLHAIIIDPNDVFTLCWSSGTTAEPKGCPLSHNNWLLSILSGGAEMPQETCLEQKIEDIVCQWNGLVKKRMFGGICYLLNGNMCFGIFKDYLIVRMAVDLAAKKLMEENVREFDITGKPMRGWVMVERGSWKNQQELVKWLDVGKSFALSLPSKLKKRRSLEEIYYRDRK
jgi:acyl-CoA synthetase (AMP-forming)/AMP-acid ligase II